MSQSCLRNKQDSFILRAFIVKEIVPNNFPKAIMEKASKFQIEIAKKLNIDVSMESSIVASAKLKSAIFEAIYPNKQKREATQKQLRFLKSLGVESESTDFLIVSALIDEELQKRNIAAIEKHNFKPGDSILTVQYGQEKIDVISSIGSNHRIWFKGGKGRGCWPSQVIKKMEN